MFDDEEEELELLRQYEGRDGDESEDNAHSSDEIDSDLEDKIMSMVQYGSGLTKKKIPVNHHNAEKKPLADKQEEIQEPEVVHAPVDLSKTKKAEFSFTNELQLNDSDVEEGEMPSGDSSESETKESDEVASVGDAQTDDTTMAEPQVTNFINLDDQQPMYMDDEDVSEEEAELNLKLQELIEDQISNRHSQTRYKIKTHTIRVCFSCNQPGHDRKDCTLCMICGGPRHIDNRCNAVRHCTYCKQRGHVQNQCENEPVNDNCRLCNMSYHHFSYCPSLLHVYTNEVASKRKPSAYCYHCSDRGHYGDECPRRPIYLSDMPSVFSVLSLERGSRFDPKKSMRESASSFSRYQEHQRWSDSSRESSPRRGYNGDRGKQRSNYNYTDDSDDGYSRKKKRRNDYSNKGDGYKYKYTSTLDQVFSSGNKNAGHHKYNGSNKKSGSNSDNSSSHRAGGSAPPQRSGNSNWKNLKKNFLPQPTRSGTMNVNSSKSHNQGYEGDFPRGGGLPKPSSSGVIDLTGESPPSKRGSKYRGGYKRGP